MSKLMLSDRAKNLIIIAETVAVIFFIGNSFFPRNTSQNSTPTQAQPEKQISTGTGDEQEFPTLYFPEEYFVSKRNIGVGAYSTLREDDGYRSYPSPKITLPDHMYSLTPKDLPSIKTDKQIHTELPEADFMGSRKAESIMKYGEIARRYAGEGGNGTSIYDIQYADLDKDGVNEQILSVDEMGANVIGQKNIVIKGDQIIFSTGDTTFSTLIPDKKGNGFFLQWDDNFKGRDGYVTTRFISENNTFKSVYEQQVRYIRIK